MVIVQGLPSNTYLDTIYSLWHTSKIQNYMFHRVTSSTITFHQFFLPDVLYTLEQVIANPKRGYGNYRALQKVVDKLKEHTWLSRTLEPQNPILNRAMLNRLTKPLLAHQTEFLDQYDDLVPRYGLRGYMLAATPGSGKTIGGIALATCLEADTVICVVPPNSVYDVWESTIQSIFKEPVTYWNSMSGEPLEAGRKYYICHYNALDKVVAFFSNSRVQTGRTVILIDESHNFNEADSLRTRLLVQLCTETLTPVSVLWSSGTPIKAIGNEAIPFLSTIDPLFDRGAEERFRGIYGKSASRALDILRNRIGNLTFKVDRAEVIKNETETIKIEVTIPNGQQYTLNAIKEEMRAFVTERMTYYRDNFQTFLKQYEAGLASHKQHIKGHPDQEAACKIYEQYINLIRKGYDPVQMKTESMYCNEYELKKIIPFLPLSLRDNFKNARSVVKYYELKVRGEALGRILGKRRAQCHVDMVEHIGLEAIIDEARKKTILFTSYVEVVDKAAEYLESLGYKPLKVYGATNKDLPIMTAKFAADEDANPMIATFQSLSTAVPLVMASSAAMLNSPFRPHEMDQARARVDRIGQDGAVKFYNIFLKTGQDGNISTRSGDILEFCREAVDLILGHHMDEPDYAIEELAELALESIEVYQEEDSIFESDGVLYDLNNIFRAVAKEPVRKINVDTVDWVLEHDTPDQYRLDNADLETPILVCDYDGKKLAVDGLHRIARAQRDGVKQLNYRFVSKKVLQDARLDPNAEAFTIKLPPPPAYLKW